MKKILLVSFMFVTALVTQSWAQEQVISGKVTSAEDGSAIPGVNVILKGTSTGTATDIDGNYKFSAPANGTLIFSFIGLISKEVSIGNQSIINVVMVSDAKQLSEVVVTGLGIAREERSLGYAVQEVSGSKLSEVREANVISSLAGRVAGAQIKSAPGNIGGSSRITLRGVSSISGNNQPLFVVDGTPIDNSNHNGDDAGTADSGRDFGNMAADINPDDVASVSILKGAAATAIYGSRGANGVILITTKSGKPNKGLGVSINSGVTFENVSLLPDYQNEYGGGYGLEFDKFEFDAAAHPAEWAAFDGQLMPQYYADESWGPKLDGTPVRQWDSWYPGSEFGKLRPWVAHPDNVKNFYKTGITLSNNVSISGGTDKSTFRLSYTNRTQTGVAPNSSLDKNTVSFSVNSKLSNKLEVGIKGNYVNTHGKGRPGIGYGGFGDQVNVQTNFNEWFERQLDISRLAQYTSEDGTPRTWNIRGPSNTGALFWESPYWVLNRSYEEDFRDRVFGNVHASYSITDDLTISGFARTDFYNFRVEDRLASGSAADVDWYEEMLIKKNENNYEFLTQYNKDFDNISLNVMVGANTRIEKYRRNKARTDGGLSVPDLYLLSSSKEKLVRNDRRTDKKVNSVYGSAGIGYNDFVYVDLTARNDWSSTLPSNNNSYFYWSASSSLVFSELIDANWLSFGKFRVGYGQVGNDTNPYQLDVTYKDANSFGSSPAFAVPNKLKNNELRPEKKTSLEFGLDMRFLQDRVGFDVAYYDEVSTDQILALTVSSASGFSSAVVNAGKITNKGIELSLYGTPLKAKNFQWDLRFNFAQNKNLVVELAEGQKNLLIASWGPSINARVGEPFGTIVADGIKLNDKGQKIVRADGFYEREGNEVRGNTQADFTGGILNDFKIYGFNVGVVVDFQKGGDLYSVTNRYGNYSGVLARTVGTNAKGKPTRDPVSEGGGILAEGVLEDGSPNTTYVDAQQYWKHLRTRRSEYIYDAGFVKLREVRIGYNLPQSIIGNLGISSANIAFVGRNLAILSKNAPNIDPETATSNSNVQGFENGQLPSVRSLGFNLNVTF